MNRVSASKFKAKLGQYMRAARMGNETTVTDRGRPVARLVPIDEQHGGTARAEIARPRASDAPPLGQIEIAPIEYRGPSTTELLSQDRER